MKKVKISIEHGNSRTETDSDLVAGLILKDEPTGYSCQHYIIGATSPEGILNAIKAMLQITDHLYDMLPIPKQLAEQLIKVDHSLHQAYPVTSEAKEKAGPFSSALLESILKDKLGNDDEIPIKLIMAIMGDLSDESNPFRRFFEK